MYFINFQIIKLFLKLKKFNAEGNFDRVSSLILAGIYWKSIDIKAIKEMSHRKKITEDDYYEKDVMNRAWF